MHCESDPRTSASICVNLRSSYGSSIRQIHDQGPRGRAAAQELAADRGNPQIDPLHCWPRSLAEGEGVVRPIFDKIGVNRGQLDRIVEAELSHFPRFPAAAPPQPSQELMQVFEAAQREAETMKDEFVSTEHLLLALAKVESKAKKVLKLNAVGEKELLQALRESAARPA